MKTQYVGPSPMEWTTFEGVIYEFPRGAIIEIPVGLGGIIDGVDYLAADEEAEAYVPAQPTTRSGMWYRSNGQIETDNGTPVPVEKVAQSSTAYTRDAAGRVATATVDGVTTTFGRDGAGRLLTAASPGRVETFTYTAGKLSGSTVEAS